MLPKPQALYDINKTFTENWQAGPSFTDPLPQRSWLPSEQWYSWLGFKLASRIGIAACPIMTGKGIALAAKLGFDVLTYKSIRSQAYAGHPKPNILFVDYAKPLTIADLTKPIPQAEQLPADLTRLAITNSFGNSSLAPDVMMEDIVFAKTHLQSGQVLNVSIYGEASSGRTQQEDFIVVACMAREAGADIIEANLSCPNIHAGRGLIYDDPDYVFTIAKAIVAANPNTPLLIKLGLITDQNLLSRVMHAVARSGAAGICGINSISMQVINQQQQPAFGKERPISGVSGFPIRELARAFIANAYQINQQQRLGLTIVGIGGVTMPEHFTQLHEAGADIALCATGVLWNPYLGFAYHNAKQV